MTRKKLLHLKSSVVNANNTPKLPTPSQIELGEIAVNYASGYETLAIKNSSNDIISFSNDSAIMNYVDEAISSIPSTSPLQTTGTSTAQSMSQSAVTRELGDKLSVSDFNTYSGAIDTAFENVVQTGRSISTASGLTGGGDLSTDRTIGLEAVGSAGTYSTVIVDAYGRVTSGNSEGGIDDTKIAFIGDVIGSGDSVTHSSSYVWADRAGQNIPQTGQTAIRTAIGAVSSSDVATQISNKVTGVGILTISATTQSAYDTATKDPNVLYVIVDEL